MKVQLGRINRVLHTLAASASVGLIADAVTRLHASAQAGAGAAGVAGLVATAWSWATHSGRVDRLAHDVERSASHVVTPGVVADVNALKEQLARYAPAADVKKMVDDAVATVKDTIPAPAKVAVGDVERVVAQVLADRFSPKTASTPVEPAAAAVPAAGGAA